jgi:hypothetical protein
VLAPGSLRCFERRVSHLRRQLPFPHLQVRPDHDHLLDFGHFGQASNSKGYYEPG